ncbi:MAG: Uma2 family endonuclease [Planctomycetaceae bacterium]
MSVQAEKRVFTVDEYHRIWEAGILSETDRVELVEGEILKRSPIGKFHAACVKRLNTVLNRKAGEYAIVSVQDPIRLDDYSEPQPDIALLKPRDDFYAHELPGVEDILLIIEVADTSVEYDKSVKLPLYAKAGIVEAWLANIRGDLIEVFSQPVDGIYQKVRMINRGEVVSPMALPRVVLAVDEILG